MFEALALEARWMPCVHEKTSAGHLDKTAPSANC